MDLSQISAIGLDGLLGVQYERIDADEVRATCVIDDRHLQPHGLVHGGVYAAIAESIGSVGTAAGTKLEKAVAGLSNQASFMRPMFKGDTLTAIARPRHKGRTTWIWDVEMLDGQDRVCAVVRITTAVRDRPARAAHDQR